MFPLACRHQFCIPLCSLLTTVCIISNCVASNGINFTVFLSKKHAGHLWKVNRDVPLARCAMYKCGSSRTEDGGLYQASLILVSEKGSGREHRTGMWGLSLFTSHFWPLPYNVGYNDSQLRWTCRESPRLQKCTLVLAIRYHAIENLATPHTYGDIILRW